MHEVGSVGKAISEAERAYIAGLIDADGAIMALIEPHKEKRFGYRVRIELKLTQKKPYILHWLRSRFLIGKVRKNRSTFDWLTRDQADISSVLNLLMPFLKIKRRQAEMALEIIKAPIGSKKDLLRIARLADALSSNNPRSRKRRRNFATMIKEFVSPND